MKSKVKKRKRKKIIRNRICLVIILIGIVMIFSQINLEKKNKEEQGNSVEVAEKLKIDETELTKTKEKEEEVDWNLTLVNYKNEIPNNYQMSLTSIDSYRKFDTRAISYLKNMLNDMKKQGSFNIWAQSTYRSIESQKQIYNNKVQFYIGQGKNEKDAKELTEQVINKPGFSEHNLGLAVDFNYVKDSFKNTKEYQWLKQNAENYGFILRYTKEKEEITKVNYEPWHWRFVGVEHAKKMNELDMCLEEYVDYMN